MERERARLIEARTGVPWRKWGPYLSERQWGTVREDYSDSGDAWDYFTHDQARSRVYRRGEDGLAGISDEKQQLCFALALWNEQDVILKERLFGLTNGEGNHGEDVKESIHNRGDASARLHVLPTLWFRNTWASNGHAHRPEIRRLDGGPDVGLVRATHPRFGAYAMYFAGEPELLFTENETNTERAFGVPNSLVRQRRFSSLHHRRPEGMREPGGRRNEGFRALRTRGARARRSRASDAFAHAGDDHAACRGARARVRCLVQIVVNVEEVVLLRPQHPFDSWRAQSRRSDRRTSCLPRAVALPLPPPL